MSITPQQLKERLAGGDQIRLIDVREPDEWEVVRLPQAELIPLSQFQQRGPDELAPDEEIVLYCHHGVRSARAQAYLQSQGYARVINLTGGIDAWAAQLDPAMKRY